MGRISENLTYYSQVVETKIENLSLDDCRNAIDEIDQSILALLKHRIDIVSRVGEYKSQQSKEGQSDVRSFARPGREAEMVRNLLEDSEGVYPKETIIAIWRNIIGASLFHEQSVNVAVHCSPETEGLYWLTREYFGSFVPLLCLSDSIKVVEEVCSGKAGFGILPYPAKDVSPWWATLAKATDSTVKIFAHVPFIVDDALHQPGHQALAIASVIPERTRSDISLLVVQTDISQGDIPAILFRSGLHGNVLDSYEEESLYLVAVTGFYDNPQAEELSGLSDVFTNIYPVGSYATPVGYGEDKK